MPYSVYGSAHIRAAYIMGSAFTCFNPIKPTDINKKKLWENSEVL